jgi:hypothetical protein
LIQGFFSLDTEEHHAGNVDMREWSHCQLGIEPPNVFCGAQGSRTSLEFDKRKMRKSADDAARLLHPASILLHDRLPYAGSGPDWRLRKWTIPVSGRFPFIEVLNQSSNEATLGRT